MQRTSTLELRDQLVSQLSGGELQRILLARALAQETPLLLLDEPTTHLDLQFQISLLDLVRQLAIQDHLTVLIALHDLNLVARYSDQVLLLVKGQQIAYGTPKDVLQPDQLSQAFQIPVQVIPGPNSGSAVVLPGCL
jgi:iron complex transport system ATP-binding protein